MYSSISYYHSNGKPMHGRTRSLWRTTAACSMGLNGRQVEAFRRCIDAHSYMITNSEACTSWRRSHQVQRAQHTHKAHQLHALCAMKGIRMRRAGTLHAATTPRAGVTESQYAAMARLNPARLAATQQALCSLLGCDQGKADRMLRGGGSLCYLTPPVLRARFTHLHELLGCEEQELVKVLLTANCTPLKLSSEAMSSDLDRLQQSLGASRQQVCSMVLRAPNRIATSIDKVEEVFDFWVQDVGVEASAARDILLMYPQLLGTATEGLRRRLEALRALFKGSYWTAEQIVASVPRVLWGELAPMAARFQYLSRAAGSHPRWKERWQQYSARTVGCRLYRSDRALRRLDKVMAAGMQERYAMSYILSIKDSSWSDISSKIDEGLREGRQGGSSSSSSSSTELAEQQ